MKIRNGYVSNSSSSSFVFKNITQNLKELKQNNNEIYEVSDENTVVNRMEQDMKWQNQNVFKWWVVNYPRDFAIIQNLKMDVDFNDVYEQIRFKLKPLCDIIFKENYYNKKEIVEFEKKVLNGMKENGYPTIFLEYRNIKNKEIKNNCDDNKLNEIRSVLI